MKVENKRILITGAGGFIGSHLAERLLEQGAEINAKDKNGNTPLHIASLMDRPANCQLLLQKGASDRIINKRGQTAAKLIRSRGLEMRFEKEE